MLDLQGPPIVTYETCDGVLNIDGMTIKVLAAPVERGHRIYQPVPVGASTDLMHCECQ